MESSLPQSRELSACVLDQLARVSDPATKGQVCTQGTNMMLKFSFSIGAKLCRSYCSENENAEKAGFASQKAVFCGEKGKFTPRVIAARSRLCHADCIPDAHIRISALSIRRLYAFCPRTARLCDVCFSGRLRHPCGRRHHR
jgi:hypothetical protein